jgi:hypothetical protein
MIPLYVTITAYDINKNTCTATLDSGIICKHFDPFVSCAIKQTDEQCKSGDGNLLIGKRYLMSSYSVYTDFIVPHEGGFTEVIK